MIDYFQPFVILAKKAYVACYKPPGIETISQQGESDLTGKLRIMLNDDGVQPVHRLDRDTSGVQLLARDPEAERVLTDLFKRREMEKEYWAICLGCPANARGGINRNLSKWQGGHRPVKVVKGAGGLPAATDYRVLASSAAGENGGKISLIAFRPRQGRTHQIRVHAAAFGYPILGDDQYGDRAANKWAKTAFGLKRQALHARLLAFSWEGERVEITAPLPSDMAAVVAAAFPAVVAGTDCDGSGND